MLAGIHSPVMPEATCILFTAPRAVEVVDTVIPDPGPDEVLIETRFSMISNGTECSFLKGERLDGETPARPGDPLPFPMVPGYQKTGVVLEAPADSGLQPGQWVATTVSRVNNSRRMTWGGHVSHAVAPLREVFPLPEACPPGLASGFVLAQVGLNCGDKAQRAEGRQAWVIGDGQVGIWAAETLAERGARVVLTGRHDWRLGLAGSAVQTSREPDLSNLDAFIRETFPGGIDILVDTVGCLPVIRSALPFMNRFGDLVSAGFMDRDSLIDIQSLRPAELTLHCPTGWMPDRLRKTLRWIAEERLPVEPLVSHRIPMEQAPEAYRWILERQPHTLGIILEWNS